MPTIKTKSSARPSGLRQLWGWVRRSILRTEAIQAARPRAASPVAADAAAAAQEPEVLEPRGSRLRPRSSKSGGGLPLQPVRQGLAEVPPLPHVVRELLKELSDPASNARSVARIAASDPALAASLIRTVNSAAVGLRRKITSITEAVSYLGYAVVRSLVIRMRLEQILPKRKGETGYDAEDLWIHSLAVSHAADCIAERVPGTDRGFVSTLGLLHDIGKLAINSQFPQSASLLRSASADCPDESFLDRERRVLGADHAEIGAILATHWKLPHDLVEAIRWHHAPQSMPASLSRATRQAAILVHVANQITKYCYVYSEDMEIDIVDDELFKEIGLAGPVTRLLTSRTRSAISRAIFFAEEAATRPLSAIRRFVRFCNADDARKLCESPRVRTRSEPRVTLVDEIPPGLISPAGHAVDCTARRPIRIADDSWKTAERVRFKGETTAASIDALIAHLTLHLDGLNLDEMVRLPARFLIRRLLPNILDFCKTPEPLRVTQVMEHGRLLLTFHSEAFAFEHRFGPDLSVRAARRVLEYELANVLNLRWFADIRTNNEGNTLVFVGHNKAADRSAAA